MARSIDFFCWVLLFFCIGMLLTGGTTLHLGGRFIEMSSLDPWMASLGALLLVRFWLGKRRRIGLPTAWLALEDATAWAAHPQRRVRALLSMLVFFFLLIWISHVFRHWNFRTHAFDTGYLHQALYYAWATPPLKCDLCLNGSYLGEHLAFSLFWIAPLASVFKQTVLAAPWIFLLQAALGFGALSWLLLRGPLQNRPELWVTAGLVLLSERAFRNSLVWDFREDLLGFFFLSLALVALNKRQLWFYFVLLAGALLSKENMGLILAFLAVPILWDPSLPFKKTERWFVGVTTLAVSVLWTWAAFRTLIPVFSAGALAQHQISTRFSGLGNTPSEILLNLLTRPSVWGALIGEKILNLAALKYLILLFGPVFYFARKHWIWGVPTLPAIGMNLLSSSSTQRSLDFHYELVFLPFLFWATLRGIEALPRDAAKRNTRAAIGIFLALMFSGRWPGAKLTQNWPTLNSIRDSSALSDLDLPRGSVLVSSLRPLAQVTQLRDLRSIGFESPTPASDAEAWLGFEAWLKRRGSPFPAHRINDATHLLVDREDPWVSAIGREAKLREWKVDWRSPGGRFEVLARNPQKEK